MIAPAIRERAPVLRRKWLGALSLAICVTGCAGTTGHLAVVGTRPIEAHDLLRNSTPLHVIGRSCIEVIGVVPMSLPSFGDAVTDALRHGHGHVLTDVTVGYDINYLPFVYGVACYVVEGDAR